jgi:lysophospholipase L1-like esterase
LDLVVLALGSNDLQWQYHADAPESARGMATLVDKVRSFRRDPGDPVPDILIVAPPRITSPADFLTDIFRGAADKTDAQQRRYAALAKSVGAEFLSMADVAKPSALDGVHLDLIGQAAVGAAMAAKVEQWLRKREAGA